MTQTIDELVEHLQVALTSLTVASAHLQLADRRLRSRQAPDDRAILASMTVALRALTRLDPQIRAFSDPSVAAAADPDS